MWLAGRRPHPLTRIRSTPTSLRCVRVRALAAVTHTEGCAYLLQVGRSASTPTFAGPAPSAMSWGGHPTVTSRSATRAMSPPAPRATRSTANEAVSAPAPALHRALSRQSAAIGTPDQARPARS